MTTTTTVATKAEYHLRQDPTRSTFNAPRHAMLEKLASAIKQSDSRPWAKRSIELVLGTDREIGGEQSPERRVGITPDNVAQLIQFFAGTGIDLTVRVLADAGIHAGWTDADYVRAGAKVIRREEFRLHATPPDVVHALKEPSTYESEIPGPFLRIGAMHGGDLSPDSGTARLLARGDVAIFDGSATGAPGKFRIAIRGPMSDFAGTIAAEWVLEHLASTELDGRIVIVGGGRVGTACVRKLAASGVREIVVCEAGANPQRLAEVARELSLLGNVRVIGIAGLDDENLAAALDGAAAVVFAVFAPGNRAPRVASLEMLRERLSPGSLVIDVSIDERGAIQDDDADPDWNSEMLIPWLEHRLDPIRYRAVPNMPREYPQEASRAHGDAVTPYLATLLYLSALEGGPVAALDRITQLPANPHCDDPLHAETSEVLSALMNDLRNGLAVYPAGGRVVVTDAVPEADRRIIETLLGELGPEGSDEPAKEPKP
ncbi:MAG TPA: NAD(P)-binding domain-containing protein [Thermoanaerobaculia bacterium]